MVDDVTVEELARELGVHHETLRSRLREFFAERSGTEPPAEFTATQVDEFLAWNASRFGAVG